MRRAWLGAALFLVVLAARAAEFDYRLEAVEIAPDTYVFAGRNEDFSVANGGNIANTGFIVTSAGVVVIDTGPTLRYAEQVRTAIRRITPLPVVRVFNTHHHPDHILGNQAYAPLEAEAAPGALEAARLEGAAFVDNVYRLCQRWATGTELAAPSRPVRSGRERVGEHELELLVLEGHSSGDLAVLDRATGVLFAGDLVFNGRAPTFPHAVPPRWVEALDTLGELPFRLLVPGHGPVSSGREAIALTRDYVAWMSATLETAAAAGLDATDVLALGLPERFRALAVVATEFPRSVMQLYPAIEQRHLRPASVPR